MASQSSLSKGGLLSNPLVAKYVAALIVRPLLTKCCTTGVLTFLQEVIACHVAGVPFVTSKRAPQYAHALAALKVDAKAVKMFIYGFFVSAPLNHYMMGTLQKFFAGKTSRGAKLGQLFAANFVVAPISTFVFLYSMAVINGAKTVDAAVARARAGFMRMLAITWVVQPSAMLAAQKFVPMELWVPFFSLVSFSLGTLSNIKVKKMQMKAALKDKKDADSEKRG
ncbi:hypothetical protein FRB96_005910 [Tulasnella sp. 330]|nr:hypothetical protein FRB96_005910 [Tulasnella sp. 330]KAG8882599.1 hypothetical protein FRB98_003575 [Tulasnella sp. 332]KAG8882841.1 hypothetical protein FRB97_007665 [Tulasnella sp. 331]